MPVIFGLPFLEINDIVSDHKNCACIVRNKNINYNLLKPVQRQDPLLSSDFVINYCAERNFKANTLHELLETFPKRWNNRLLPDSFVPQLPNFISSILHHIKTIEFTVSMETYESIMVNI